jgi:phospholipase A1
MKCALKPPALKPVLVAAALFLLSPPAHASDWLLATDTVELRPGAAFVVDVVYAGTGAANLPDKLTVRANAGSRSWRFELAATEAVKGSRRRYAGLLPADAAGAVVLDLVAHRSSKLALIVRGRADPVSQLVTPRPAAEQAAAEASEGGPVAELPQQEAVLSVNEPMYFLLGNRQGASARYQLSFKYRFFDPDTGIGKNHPWLTGLYFAYTQNSFWDLSSESRPFRDTSYRPSLYLQLLRASDKAWMDSARVGFEHESNGRDGFTSRSVNTVFFQPMWRFKLDDHEHYLTFDPKIYSYVGKDDNPDIQQYRGYVDWRLRYGREDGFIAASTIRVGTSGRGSVQLDASYPLRKELAGGIGGYWHVQYFNGYGEDILGYNQKRNAQLRIGFSIVR